MIIRAKSKPKPITKPFIRYKMFKSGKQLVTSSIAGLAVIGTVGFLSQTEVHADTTEITGTSDVQAGGNAVTATTSSEKNIQNTNTTSSAETTQGSNKNQISEAKQSNQQSTTTSLTAKSLNDERVSLTTESSKQGNDVAVASKDTSTNETKDNSQSTDAKVETTNLMGISKLTTNAIGLTESKAVSTTGTDNQQYGSDMTSRFYGSGQSANHNANQTDPTADYMGHTDRYFSDAQVETNVDNIPVNNKGFQFGNNVWQIQLPKEITSLSDWISKLNVDPDYTIGVIDEAGQRHYLTADSLKPFTNSQINSGYTFDAVNMDSAGKWVKVGTWVVTYTRASDGYPYLILGCEMTEWPKSLSAVPALPVFVTSPNQKRIFNVRVSQYSGAITGTDASDNGSSIYAPIGPGISETGRDMSAHNYGATYTINSGQLSQGLIVTIDGGGNYNFASYHSLSFSNGKDPAVDLNSAWTGELNAYDSNGNVIGKYKWQFNDEGGAPVGEQYMVAHGSWIKYIPNNPSSGVAPMPLVARYLSDNNGEKGKIAFTFMPNAYAARPTSLDIKKVIIHYVDAETGESLNQGEVYEIAAQRSNTDNSWTNATPTVHQISGDKASTFSNLSVTSNGTFKFSVKTNDPKQTTFNAQFTIPTISKLNVNYPVNIYQDWNPYTLTVQVVQPKIDYQIKYVDVVTGQTVGTQNVSDKGMGDHTINYSLPAGYQLVPASDYPKTVKSDNGQLLFDDQTSHAHVTNATVIPVKVVKNNTASLTSDLVKLHQGVSFNKDTFASLVPTISINSQNATDKGELTYSYDGIQKYALDMDAQGRVEQIQINNPGLVATATFQGNLGNLVDQNGNPSTAINKIVREYYALEPGGRLAIYKASENMYGADHSPFYLNGFLYDGAKAIKIVTHYYDNSGNELKINLASDILPIALTGMHAYAGTVSGVKLEDSVESNVASNQSVLVKTLADDSTLVSSVAGDHSSYRPMGIAGTSQGAGYIIGAFDPTTGETSTGTSKNLGYVMLSQPYDIQMSDSLQMKTVEAKRTIHFVDNNGNKVHDDVEQNVSWLQVYQDGKLLNTMTDKSFNSVVVPTITGQTPSVTVVPTESVSADSPVNESYTVTYVPSSTVTVNVAKPGETITITPDSQDKHGYDDAYFKQTMKRIFHYTDQTGKETDYDGGSVTFTRNGHWDPINSKMTFDDWSNGGSYTFSAATAVIPQTPAGYALTGDYQPKTVTPNVESALVTHGNLTIDSTVGVKANAQQLVIHYMDDNNQVGSMTINGVTDQEVTNFRDQIKQNLPTGYVLANENQVAQSYKFVANPSAVNIQVMPEIVNIDPNNPSTYPNGYTEHDFKRTVTRNVTITEPNQQPVTTHQTVTFVRGGKYNQVTKQVQYDSWSENGSHQFVAVAVPAHKGYTPSQATVDAVTVKPDSQNSTVNVTYQKNANVVISDPSKLPSDSNVKASDLSKTVQRVINITPPDGNKDTQTQTVTFTRGVELDAATDQLVKYLPWSENGSHQFVAVTVPSHKGYTPSQKSIDTITVTPDSQNSTIDVAYTKNPNLVINDPSQLPSDSNVKASDLSKTVQRQVTITSPDGKADSQTQSVTFTRGVELDPVTDQLVKYLPWSENGQHTFEAVRVPTLAGYQASGNIPAQSVTPDTADTTINITYEALGQNVNVKYVDGSNNPVSQQVLAGKTDQTKQLVAADFKIPQGWQVVGDLPTTVHFVANNNPDIVVKLSHILTPLDQTKPDTWPKDAHLTPDDFSRTIKRTVTIHPVSGEQQTTAQSVTFTRGGKYDEVLHKVIFDDWSDNGQHTFEAVIAPTAAGYSINGSAPALTVTPESARDQKVDINYVANGQSSYYSFVDDDLNGKAVGDHYAIAGKTDQKIDLNITLPANYQLANGQALPTSYTFKANDNQPLTIHLAHRHADGSTDTNADVKRTITRTINVVLPDGKVTKIDQSTNFTRSATKDLVTNQLSYGDWSNKGQTQLPEFIQDDLKGYNKTGSAPALTVTPDSKDTTVQLGYVKQADKVIKADDPSTWPAGITKNDLIRTITRGVTINEPDGKADKTQQTVTFKRNATQDPVTDSITFEPWSENSSHVFDAVNVPTFKGYTPSQAKIDSLTVTPNSKDSSVVINYEKNANITVNDPKDLPSDSNVKASDLSKTITRTITINVPNGKLLITKQTVTFTRGVELDPVTDQLIKYLPWSENGQHEFEAISVPSFKGYTSSQTSIDKEMVTPNSKDSSVVINYKKNANITVNDPKDLPSDSNVKASDLSKTITRTITINVPNGKPQVTTQTVTFKRGVELDPVTDQLVKYLPWSEDGKHEFDAIPVPSFKGYTPSQTTIAGETVTPDTKETDANVVVNYTKNANIVITDPSQLPSDSNVKTDDLQKTIQRVINITDPAGKVTSQTQSVTFKRGVELDSVTDQLVKYLPWSENGQHVFSEVSAPELKGYDKVGSAPTLTVTPDSTNSVVELGYRKQADKVIKADDPSTWPSGITNHDLIRDIKRTIEVKLPAGTTKTKIQSVEFKRNATQDPVNDKITFGAWSHDGKYQFDAFTPEAIDGYEAKPSMVAALEVTPDSKDSEVVISYQKLPTNNAEIVDSATTPSNSQFGPAEMQQSVVTSQSSSNSNQSTLPQTGNNIDATLTTGFMGLLLAIGSIGLGKKKY